MLAPVRLLSKSDLTKLMTQRDYFDAVEQAFAMALDPQKFRTPPPMHLAGTGGAFHVKGSTLFGDQPITAVKLNGNFPGNVEAGLPTIQGAILVADATNGALLAIMDSAEVTLRRTAAASAVAAHYLAREQCGSATVIGCGAQALAQCQAISDIRSVGRWRVWDQSPGRAKSFANIAREKLDAPVNIAPDLAEALNGADIIITCTTSKRAFVTETQVAPGAFIAAVGADNPEKSEIAPSLMARATVVTDATEQCAHMGDLHHAIAAGEMSVSDVYASLGEIVAGHINGRRSEDEIIIFDSTGVAFQDVASAARIIDKAGRMTSSAEFSFA